MMVGLPTRAEPYPIIHRPPVIEPEATLADNFKAWEVMGWTPSTRIETWYAKHKEKGFV